MQVSSVTASAGALHIAVQAPPRDGEANEAVGEALARVLGLKKRDVTLTLGGKSRDKVFRAQGIDSQTAASRLNEALEKDG